MTEQFQENFFLAIRMLLLMVLEIYIIITHYTLAGASAWMLLLLACFTGAVVSKELTDGRLRLVLAGISCILCVCIIIITRNEFLLIGIYVMFEIVSMAKQGLIWYFMPLVPACINIQDGTGMQLLITILIGMVYVQNDFIVAAYKKQAIEEEIENLKNIKISPTLENKEILNNVKIKLKMNNNEFNFGTATNLTNYSKTSTKIFNLIFFFYFSS